MTENSCQSVGKGWQELPNVDAPTREETTYKRRTVPVDYGPNGGFVRSDGQESRTTATVGLTYEEMISGYYVGKPDPRKDTQEHKSAEDLVTIVPAQYLELHDQYDHLQGDPHPWEAIFRAHVLRLVKGWNHEKALHTYLKKKPCLTGKMGFNSVPDQSTLWRAWEYRFTDEIQTAIQTTAEVIVEHARYENLVAPDPDFLPEDIREDEDESEALAREKAQQVWQHVKPFVTDCFELDRGDNASIPETSWWEQHAYMGMRTEMYPNSGADSFATDSTRDKTPSGDSHRYQLKKLGIENVRRMHREATQALITRARSRKELHGNVTVAIDITKGNPWTGTVRRNSSGELKEPWILGYKDGGVYFQWAVIKIVGHDIPFILDAVPVVRGRERADIVDDLLDGALSILPDISLVMMDREFDSDGVKRVCEDHGVSYLNPARVWKNGSHGKQIREMNDVGREFDVVEQKRLDDGESRKAIYLPKREWSRDEAEEDTETVAETTVRQEMLDEWDLEEDDLGSDDEDDRSPFESFLSSVAEEEDIPEREEFDAPMVAFETNHPLVDTNPKDEREMKHQIGRMMAKYKRRWGIENGFKKIKKFICRTKSKDHEYRYFNFAFACVLYNCWRIVDLLVQLSIKDDPTYSPEIDANLFLTLSKDYFGLDPPD